MLAFSRKQTLKPQIMDLRDTLSDLTHLLNRLVGERVGLTITYDPALRAIRADKRQLEQVIMNLVVNARDAMPDGGRITIETANKWLDRSAARRHEVPEGQYLSLCVTDTGTGMTPEVVAKAFDPFFTTKGMGAGLGLGLSISANIVRDFGGTIACRDAAPGAEFRIALPIALETAA